MAEPPKKQYCDNCYEKLPLKKVSSVESHKILEDIPEFLVKRISSGDLYSVRCIHFHPMICRSVVVRR